MNDNRINVLRRLAGIFLIVTNTHLPEKDVVSAYKDLWKSERIEAHVFVCVLSLLISSMMEEIAGRTMESIRNDLDYLDVVPVAVDNRTLYLSSESSQASEALKSLGLRYPRIHESAHT